MSTPTSVVDFEAPAVLRYRKMRALKDIAARYSIAAGGLGVILAILLIFFYLLYEVLPMFASAEVEPRAQYAVETTEPVLYSAVEEQAEVGMQLGADGLVQFFQTADGALIDQVQLPIPDDVQVTRLAEAGVGGQLLAAGLSNGRVLLFKHNYRISYPDDRRVITPQIEYPFGDATLSLLPNDLPVTQLALRDSENALLLIGANGNRLFGVALNKEIDFLTEEVTFEEQFLSLPDLEGRVKQLLVDPAQHWLYVAHGDNQLSVFNLRDFAAVKLHENRAVTSGKLTQMDFLLGGISLLIGDDQGQIGQWFMVRDDQNQYHLKAIRAFQLGSAPIVALEAEHRRKTFVAADSAGLVGLFSATAERAVLKETLTDQPLEALTLSPRGNALLLTGPHGATRFFSVHNEHPDISWSALWHKVWYESYQEPDYIWQSSASNNDFEPKMSLMPLSFGTLKAAFYAMLLATPLAIGGAIYTAYFMAPGMRRKVKPVIELMEALPTVILGFLAGLWLAPLVEDHLPGIFALLLLLLIAMLAASFGWQQLPEAIRHRVPEGWDAALLIPVVLVAGWLAFSLSTPLEVLMFGGDMRRWLSHELGIPFDQRNALVVGLAMGFAVIPTIFSITEDAIFSVPKSLTYGSLALGATPWQTLIRVVLLTASPGIFSAVMIGMGRAVGETMIVLMATGNTLIMDANIFEGMRTLAANIAVEMPESEVGSTHYRVLFLAALVLFMFTFIVNTFAESVRHRLRKKYSSL